MELPARMRSYGASAEHAKKFYFRLVLLELAFATAIPVVALLLIYPGTAPYVHDELEIVTVLFTLGLILQLYVSLAQLDRKWYTYRSIAESMATLCWQYAVGAEDFPVSDANAERTLRDRLGEIESATPQLPHHSTWSDTMDASIPASMTALRGRPWTERRDTYLKERLSPELAGYIREGRFNARMDEVFTAGVIAIQLLGIGLALWLLGQHFTTDEVGVAFIALLAVLTSSFLAWNQAHQYSEAAPPYQIAARELGKIKTEIESESTEAGFLLAVGGAELSMKEDRVPLLGRRRRDR